MRRTVGCEFNNPALIKLKRRLEHVFFILGQKIQMLDRTLVDGDGGPSFLFVLAFLRKNLPEIRVSYVERTGKRLMSETIGGHGFNPR